MKDERIDVRNPTSGVKTTNFDRIIRVIRDYKTIPRKIKRRVLGQRMLDWDANAAELGAYSVIGGRHAPGDYEYVTERTKEIIYPYSKNN